MRLASLVTTTRKVFARVKKTWKVVVFVAKVAPMANRVVTHKGGLVELVATAAWKIFRNRDVRSAVYLTAFTSASIGVGFTLAVYNLGKRRGRIAQQAGCMCRQGGDVESGRHKAEPNGNTRGVLARLLRKFFPLLIQRAPVNGQGLELGLPQLGSARVGGRTEQHLRTPRQLLRGNMEIRGSSDASVKVSLLPQGLIFVERQTQVSFGVLWATYNQACAKLRACFGGNVQPTKRVDQRRLSVGRRTCGTAHAERSQGVQPQTRREAVGRPVAGGRGSGLLPSATSAEARCGGHFPEEGGNGKKWTEASTEESNSRGQSYEPTRRLGSRGWCTETGTSGGKGSARQSRAPRAWAMERTNRMQHPHEAEFRNEREAQRWHEIP